jgi:hypothetical protein
MDERKYEQYRWFFTSSGKLVIGGKSASQNESIVEKASDLDTLLHTSAPGSPFCTIKNPDKKDIKETAIFTACFSQEWKKNKEIEVNVFLKEDITKTSKMKEGTFNVRRIQETIKVKNPCLYLKFQKEKLRAVPFKPGIVVISQGKKTKEETGKIIKDILEMKIKKSMDIDEIYSAIPSGNMEVKAWP